MIITYTGTNPSFLEQSFFDLDGVLSVDLTSVTPTQAELTHTVFSNANVFVVLRGTGFTSDGAGTLTSGQITSLEFNGLDIRQATITDIDWSATAFQDALADIGEFGDFAGLAALFNSAGPLVIDASAGLSGLDQELTFLSFIDLLTQPLTFIGSRFDDSVVGTSGNDVIDTRENNDDGDRIAASEGNDLIRFNLADGSDAPGYYLDYDPILSSVTFNVDGVTNTGSVLGPGFTDSFQNVNDALGRYLGLEGTVQDDTYNIRLADGQVLSLIGGSGDDTYNVDSDGGIPILDFFFSSVSSGVDVDLATGIIAEDGFGGTDTYTQDGPSTRTVVLATSLDDRVADGPDTNLVRLYQGDDLFEASNTGNDSIDGGSGTDTALFADMTEGQSTITFSGALSIVEDRENPGGSTTLFDVETIETQGGVQFELSKHDGIGLISGQNLTELTELYIAYFNRAADALGLSFWATAFEINGFNLREIAELFFDQPETRALYDGMSNGEFVDAVYNNVFDRDADTDGFEFWTNQLDLGNVTQAGFIVDFLAGARADTGSDRDVSFIETKTDIGLYYAVVQGQSDVSDARAVMDAYDGTASGLLNAIGLSDTALSEAEAGSTDLLLPVVGVIDDPFAVAV